MIFFSQYESILGRCLPWSLWGLSTPLCWNIKLPRLSGEVCLERSPEVLYRTYYFIFSYEILCADVGDLVVNGHLFEFAASWMHQGLLFRSLQQYRSTCASGAPEQVFGRRHLLWSRSIAFHGKTRRRSGFNQSKCRKGGHSTYFQEILESLEF